MANHMSTTAAIAAKQPAAQAPLSHTQTHNYHAVDAATAALPANVPGPVGSGGMVLVDPSTFAHMVAATMAEDMRRGLEALTTSTLRLKDGSIYTGAHKDNQPHGKGRIDWPDGSYFDGNFVDGLKEGPGYQFFSPGGGWHTKGTWVKGQLHGKAQQKNDIRHTRWQDVFYVNGKEQQQGCCTIL